MEGKVKKKTAKLQLSSESAVKVASSMSVIIVMRAMGGVIKAK